MSWEKMGECQVSIGDQDLAKDHFKQSLRLLEEGAKTESIKSTSYYEAHSSLCFYIGQLSLENDALEAYKEGIRSLEECLQSVENESSTAVEQEVVEMQDDSDDANNKTSSINLFPFYNKTVLLPPKYLVKSCNGPAYLFIVLPGPDDVCPLCI